MVRKGSKPMGMLQMESSSRHALLGHHDNNSSSRPALRTWSVRWRSLCVRSCGAPTVRAQVQARYDGWIT